MSANVETMFYTREKPWHGLGTKVDIAPTSKEALELAGLNWTINGNPVLDMNGVVIPGYVANTRSSDGKVLGIVGSRYQIVQNTEAFEFTDALIGDGVTYETAGSLLGGRKIWLLAKMPERYIAGDKTEPYLCFTNTHDGTGAVRVCMTPVRVVCNNTLNAALSSAKRAWSVVHRGCVKDKLDDARETLQLADKYMDALDEEATKLAEAKFSMDEAQATINKMIALPEEASDRQKRTAETVKDGIVMCMLRPDVAQFLNTKWGFINAVADYAGHSEPIRHTKSYDENRWGSIISGHPLLDKAMALVR